MEIESASASENSLYEREKPTVKKKAPLIALACAPSLPPKPAR
jgi:hypothetical protein